jgi:ATPase subunit of ABC transporter with duplicated ATPase domains
MHKPIQIKNLSLSFPHKICFEDFTTQVYFGSRIVIIGQNGCGKSTLLKILQGLFEPTSGDAEIPSGTVFGYVPQVIEYFDSLSGGQRFNEAMTKALSLDPDVLLLDEPTNHLDCHNRKSLMRMLKSYPGTLIIVSHDIELLRCCVDTLWHIDEAKVRIFTGNYDDYIREIKAKRASIEREITCFDRQKQNIHNSLMKEQKRTAKSKAKGKKKIENKRWMKATGDLKAMKAEKSQGGKLKAIDNKKQELSDQLSSLRLPEIIVPKFSLSAQEISDRTLVSITEGTVAYQGQEPLLQKINISLSSKERIAIMGDNGSGKSTLIKAILNDPSIIKTGDWHMPKSSDIGYLDQHYGTLSSKKSVLETISELIPSWSHAKVRQHLNDFLFRKNEEVNAFVYQLSGGEKVRLSLAGIAAKIPKLLILDEITNNLDIETCEHIIQVLRDYPGAMMVISHDEDFLSKIAIKYQYVIKRSVGAQSSLFPLCLKRMNF